MLMSNKGTVLRCDVNGKIVMKVFLSGMPDVKLGLNDKLEVSFLNMVFPCFFCYLCYASSSAAAASSAPLDIHFFCCILVCVPADMCKVCRLCTSLTIVATTQHSAQTCTMLTILFCICLPVLMPLFSNWYAMSSVAPGGEELLAL